MKRYALLATVMFLACRFACGEEPGVNYEQLRFFEPYIGTWTNEEVLQQDSFFGKKGDEGSSSITWRWAYDKKAIEWEWKFDYAGKKSGTKGLMSWDAAHKRLMGAGIASIGGFFHVTGRTIDPLSFLVEGNQPDGKTASQIETFTLSGDDTLIMQATQRQGLPVTEDSPPQAFTRVKSSDEESGANYEHLKPMAWIVGEWVCDTTLPMDVPDVGKTGDPFRVVVKYEWTLNKNFLLVHFAGGAPGKMMADRMAVVGWDAEQKQAFVDTYDRQGGTARSSLHFTGADTHSLQTRSTAADGAIEQGSLTVKQANKDAFTYKFNEGQANEWVMEFTRQK